MHNQKYTALHTPRLNLFRIDLGKVVLTHNLLKKFVECRSILIKDLLIIREIFFAIFRKAFADTKKCGLLNLERLCIKKTCLKTEKIFV